LPTANAACLFDPGGASRGALRAFVIAPVAIIAAFALGGPSIGGIVLFVLASVALTTGAIGICPGYVPFGIDTHGRGHARTPLPY
jgi:hypothetical protein